MGSSRPKLVINPVTALAMHRRALASTLLVPMHPLNSLEAAYPSAIDHCPDPYMATASFPWSLMVSFIFSAIRSRASLMGTSTILPFLRTRASVDSVFAVKDLNGMIAFYAAQPFVDRTVGIAFDGHGAITGNADQQAAACAAKPAGRLFPFNPSRRWIQVFPGAETDSRKQYRSSSDGTLYSCGFYELSSANFHLRLLIVCLSLPVRMAEGHAKGL